MESFFSWRELRPPPSSEGLSTVSTEVPRRRKTDSRDGDSGRGKADFLLSESRERDKVKFLIESFNNDSRLEVGSGGFVSSSIL